MSVSEFRNAVHSSSVWNEWVELDDELFLTDEGEGLWLSILKYYIVICSSFFCHKFHYYSQKVMLSFFSVPFSGYLLPLFVSSFFIQLSFNGIFEKMKSGLFHQGKVDSLFVIVGGNRICHGCVFGD